MEKIGFFLIFIFATDSPRSVLSMNLLSADVILLPTSMPMGFPFHQFERTSTEEKLMPLFLRCLLAGQEMMQNAISSNILRNFC
jgi:hypothetical protein